MFQLAGRFFIPNAKINIPANAPNTEKTNQVSATGLWGNAQNASGKGSNKAAPVNLARPVFFFIPKKNSTKATAKLPHLSQVTR